MPIEPQADRRKVAAVLARAARAVPMLADLPEGAIAELAARGRIVAHDAHHLVFCEGEPAEALYVVLDGQAKVFRTAPGGGENVLRVFEAGAVFAVTAVLALGVYPASCETLKPTRLVVLPYRALAEVAVGEPSLRRTMIGALLKRQGEIARQIAEVKSKSVLQRLVGYLLSLTGERDGPAQVRLPVTRVVLAAQIGTAPENLSRDLARLGSWGVTVDGTRVNIADLGVLRDLYDHHGGTMECGGDRPGAGGSPPRP